MSDFAEKHIKMQQLEALTGCWKLEKEKEEYHRNARLEIEERLLDLGKINPKSNSTHRLPHNLICSCKLKRKWDQEFIHSNYDLWHKLEPQENPFKVEYKEDKRKMDALQLVNKDLYDFLQKGLALTPAKPSFRIYKPKED